MKKMIIKILPLFALAVSLFSCNKNQKVTVTIDAGLGHFIEGNIYKEQPLFATKTFKVSSNTTLANLPDTPVAFAGELGGEDLSDEEFIVYPLYYTNSKGKKLSLNSTIGSNVTLTAHYLSSFASAKSAAFSTYIQGFIGAMKRCYMSSKPVEPLVKFNFLFDNNYDQLQCIYPCFAMGKTGAALCDAYGETQRGELIDLYEIMYQQICDVNNQVAFASSSAYQGIVGAVKRVFMSGKDYQQEWWENFIVDITDAMKEAGPTNARWLSKMGAALSDQISETMYEKKEIQIILNDFIFNAFKRVREEKVYNLYNISSTFVGTYKRAIMDGKDDAFLITLINEYMIAAEAIL